MPQNKTRQTNATVTNFINTVEDEQRRADCFEISALMEKITGSPPAMWGTSIVGFGEYHYKYDSGREGDHMRAGFSSRKAALTLYIMTGFSNYNELMKKLGKYKIGKSCLYIKKLDDIDRDVLTELIIQSVAYMNEKYPEGAVQ